MPCSRMMPSASRNDCAGPSVTGAKTIPLSARFTRSTSRACSPGVRFLWTMPSPPSRAIVMAARASVTESIAALTSGMVSSISASRRVRVSTSLGRTSL